MKKTFTDLTWIKNPRYPKRLGKLHLVFDAECDDLPFTLFPEMPGYKILSKMISLNIDKARCTIRWKYLNSNYNRCEGLIFDGDFVHHVDYQYKQKHGD